MRTFGFLAAVATIIALGCMHGMDRRGVDHSRHLRERWDREAFTSDFAPGDSRLEFATASPASRGHFAAFSGKYYRPGLGDGKPELRIRVDPASAKAGEPGSDAGEKSADDKRQAKEAVFRSDEITQTSEAGVFLVTGTWTHGDAERRVSFPARLDGERGSRTLTATMTVRPSDIGMSPPAAGSADAVTLTLSAKVMK